MFEREFPSAIAEAKVTKAAESLSLMVLTNYANASRTVAVCMLKNSSGVTVAEGAGKGLDCRVGALAESLEHYVLNNCSSESLVTSVINDIRDQPLLQMDGVLANLPQSNAEIDCLEMTDVLSGRAVVLPAVLQLPHVQLVGKVNAHPQLSFLSRYSSNSGMAFGCARNEAILHGLNEIIERHTLSKVMMSLCAQHERLFLNSPAEEVLDDIFSEQPEFRYVVDGMKILITETIYGAYFCLALPKRPDGRYPMCPIGSGCSVDAHVAIVRATTELVQALELFDESEKENDFKAYALVQKSFKLQPLIHLEPLRNIESVSKRFDPPKRIRIADQIDFLISRVISTGLNILYRDFLTFSNGCAVTQVYIPGMERFNLIRAGIPVVPQHLLHANRAVA
jgi:ribosomal protein S12 methylthiotransferase accessory factor